MLPKSFQQRVLEYRIKKDRKVKQSTIEEFQKKYGYNVLIETGTFLGDMVETQRNNFKRIFSIELQYDLAEKARERFKDMGHIKILQGDSGKLLKTILTEVKEPAIFWLDAHYSNTVRIDNELIETAKTEKETPIMEELAIILSEGLKKNVILIDDARCFKGENDYPTIKALKDFLKRKGIIAMQQIKIKNDIIRITPMNKQD